MLSRPKHGWTTVTIGEFVGSASYITDVPMDCLIAFINSLENGIPAAVNFDEEGSEFTLVASYNGVYIISEREKTELVVIEESFLNITKKLIESIENNLDGWVTWQDYYECSEEEIKEREKLIIDSIEKLKELVKIEEQY